MSHHLSRRSALAAAAALGLDQLLANQASPLPRPGKLYWLLWFDTEDYIEPTSDDAAKRLAEELDKLGVKATFKVVAEKAKVLEKRGRKDVIAALAKHDIGYHSENHSVPPTPAVYMEPLNWQEGIAEFLRREGPGAKETERIFGKKMSCYGQPGNSWSPHANPALRNLGIPVYMDEARQVGLNRQPFWYGGLAYVFNLQEFSVRADLHTPADLDKAIAQWDAATAKLRGQGGGVLQTYYHPTEWVAEEFWDGVNFRHGQYTSPENYKKPRLRTAESRAIAWNNFLQFVAHAKKTKGVEPITAAQLIEKIAVPSPLSADQGRAWLQQEITVRGPYSAADQLLAVLGLPAGHVDGPSQATPSVYQPGTQFDRGLWERSKRDAVSYIRHHQRLPSHVWIGSDRLSLEDFATTVAFDTGGEGKVTPKQGRNRLGQYIGTDARKNYDWVIHPATFAAPNLLELARLQAWTLKEMVWK